MLLMMIFKCRVRYASINDLAIVQIETRNQLALPRTSIIVNGISVVGVVEICSLVLIAATL